MVLEEVHLTTQRPFRSSEDVLGAQHLGAKRYAQAVINRKNPTRRILRANVVHTRGDVWVVDDSRTFLVVTFYIRREYVILLRIRH